VPEVRVIGADGSQVGILPTHEALKLAEEQGLELVEVNPRAAPPVCRIMDFGKFKYETSKKEKAAHKHQVKVVIKEMKLRPKTDKHDLEFKLRQIREFLTEGNKCKLSIVFRGREIVHPETGEAMLNKVVVGVQDIAQVEQRALMEGRRMIMVIGPRAGVVKRAAPPPASPPGGSEPVPAAASGGAASGSSGGSASSNSPPAALSASPSTGEAKGPDHG